MLDKQPGFGAKPRWIAKCLIGSWGLFFGITGLLVGNPRHSGSWIFLILAGTLAVGWGVRNIYRGTHDDELASRLPPTPQEELTRRVLAWTKTPPADLAANRQGTLTPAQRQRVQSIFDHPTFPATIGPVEIVEGQVNLSAKRPRNTTYYVVKLGPIKVEDADEQVVLAFKRTAHYRLYFARLSYEIGIMRYSHAILVSGEALGDA